MSDAAERPPMRLSEIRAELLVAHEYLREFIDKTRQAVERAQDESGRAELRMSVGRLVQRLREHNIREEDLLSDPLFRLDSAGHARSEAMNAEHVAEHTELCAAFVDANMVSPKAIAHGTLLDVLDRLAAHIAHEDKLLFQ
jgi:hypothetical protein